eukprot:NODE_8625_length_374_cov_188.097179.p4 GENE.NODE_8625_length_374_cov_188.097179~~NODE_8625_length_374_cov_188.097179.p4  ORF type:complete len:50 (-),score=1.05 NODE_8625_length_374_cov_188.097179:21-170(-)
MESLGTAQAQGCASYHYCLSPVGGLAVRAVLVAVELIVLLWCREVAGRS